MLLTYKITCRSYWPSGRHLFPKRIEEEGYLAQDSQDEALRQQRLASQHQAIAVHVYLKQIEITVLVITGVYMHALTAKNVSTSLRTKPNYP